MQQRTPEEYKAAYEHHRKAGNDAKAARVAQLYRDHMAQQPKPKDGAFEGFGDAFKRGIDQPLENFGTTAKVLGAENLGQSLQDAVDAPPGQSASAQFMNADKDGSFAWRYLPKAAVEQSGQFAGSLLTRAGGAAAGGAVAGPGGAIAGGLAGPMLFEAVQQLGPIALERAKNNGRTEPNAEDFIYAAGTSAGVGALNAIAPGASGKIKRMLLEGLTEGTQSVGEQTGSTINTQKGLEVDPRQALAEGIIGGSSAGMVDASISTVSAATNLVRGSGKKKDSEMSDADTEAQASLAQRLSNIATANNYDLNDIDRTSTTGARETVDAAHVQYTEDLMQLFKDLKDRVKVTDADSLSVVQNKILARAAYREGKNKTKNKVGAQEMAALEKLAGDTYEGQQAMSLLRQMNQLTQIHNDGYKGGASRLTDQFAPFGLGGEGYDSSRANAEQVLRPLLTGGLASVTGGASLIPQAAAYGTGRMIDKITGNRSKVNSFVSDNVGNEGIKVGSHPNPESLRERRREEAQAAQEAELAAQAAAEQRAAEEREANLARVQAGAPPLMGSPEDVFRDGTGLDRSGLAQVIRILKSNPNTRAATRRAIEAYETSIATGGRVDFSLIRDINALVDQYPQLKQLQVRPRNQGAATQAVQQQLSQQDANYQRGIENNKAFAQQLQDALAEDNSVLPIHKAHLGEALNQMQLDLGAAPVKRLKAIEDRLAEKGVPTEAAAKYFGPYVERVVAQQEAKADRDATAAALDEDPINDARIVPVPRGNERMQQIFGVTDPGEGGNYIDLDSKEDLTGNTYTGGVVKIIDGKPLLETNDAPAAPASKDSGNKVKVNLFKQKAGWKWIDYDGPETIVSTHQGSKHHYSLSSDFKTPVTLQTYPKQPSEPRLRPTSQGKVVLGNKIGSISVRGKVHPVYDQVTIVDKRVDKPKSERMKDAEAAGYDTSTVYYHGTASDIASFEKGKRGLSTGSTSAQNGFWFSDSPETARSYAHHSGTYAPVHNLVKEAEDADAVYGSEKIDQETMLVLDELITSVGIDANGFEKDSDGNPIPVSGYDAYDKLLDTAEKLELKFNSGDRNNGQNIIPIYPPKDVDLLVKDMKGKSFNDEGVSPEINDLMRKAKLTGKKGVKLLNLNDSAGIAEDPSTHIAIFEPSNIRSVNAQFDPAKADSDRILDSKVPALTSVSSPNVIDIMDGVEDVPKLKGKTEVATFLQERALEKLGGQPRDLASEADRDAIADDMVAEAVHEMENQDDAMEWYDSTIAKTLSMMSMKHPELDTDPDAKTAFLISLAITSQNLAVPENLQYGEEVYQHFSQNGRFLEKKFGSKGGAVKLNLEKANMLLDRLGSMEALRDFLETKFTVRELDQVLKQHLDTDSKQVSGENVDTEVYGAQVFGPKIGNGFYTNLRGDFSPVTIDMWFMRTVGRLQGKVLSFDEKRFNNQLQRLKTALGRKRMSKDALIAKAQQLKSKHESDFKKFRSEYDSGKRKKSDATKAAEQIVISLKGTRDVPANGTERNQLRDIVNRAVVKFKDQTGIDIPPASFQALIWYPEQDLYKSLGVNLKSTRQDYASSTKRFLIQEGYNEEDLNRAADRVRLRSEQGAGSAQPGTSQANQETVGAAGGRTGRPLQEEKSPVLTTEDPVNNSVEAAFARVQRDYLEPTPAEIKEKLPEAEDLVQFTIGKKGSSYEDGITSEADIRRIADLLNISISIVNEKGAVPGVISEDSRGNYAGKNRGTTGLINVRGPEVVGKSQYIATLLHEVSHGLEGQTLDGEEAGFDYAPSPHPKGSKKYNADTFRHGTFREHMHYVLKLAKGDDIYGDYQPDVSHLTLPDYDEAKEIRKEIDAIQSDSTAMRFTGFAPGSIDTDNLIVRPPVENYINIEAQREAAILSGQTSGPEFDARFKKSKTGLMKNVGRPFIRYTKDVAEFSVDPLIVYLQDPQMMKLIAPTTSKYIQKVYNKANMPVKFYSSPLVAVMAILLAGLAKGIGGEEEEQQPGALSMQPGLLTT